MITNDDRSAPLSLLRVGDAIQVSASGTVRDRSLHHITLSGVVAIEPGVDGSALIMTDGRTNQVIVDVSSSTSYRDTSRQTDSLDDLSVGDMLHVNGIADGTLGEVTLTQSLTRVGPVRHAGTSHS